MFNPQEGITRVFISYSNENSAEVSYISEALKRNGFTPYVAEWSPIPGEYISKKIANAILESLNFVYLLTKTSITSQWLNQELGFAYALKHLNDVQKDQTILKRFPLLDTVVRSALHPFNPIEIYPIIEKGLDFKGFIDKSIEYIPYDPKDSESAAINLLPHIRTRVRENYQAILPDLFLE